MRGVIKPDRIPKLVRTMCQGGAQHQASVLACDLPSQQAKRHRGEPRANQRDHLRREEAPIGAIGED